MPLGIPLNLPYCKIFVGFPLGITNMLSTYIFAILQIHQIGVPKAGCWQQLAAFIA
jgi:hypothetical protein